MFKPDCNESGVITDWMLQMFSHVQTQCLSSRTFCFNRKLHDYQITDSICSLYVRPQVWSFLEWEPWDTLMLTMKSKFLWNIIVVRGRDNLSLTWHHIDSKLQRSNEFPMYKIKSRLHFFLFEKPIHSDKLPFNADFKMYEFHCIIKYQNKEITLSYVV